MKVQFSIVIGSSQDCEEDEFQITHKLRKFIESEYKGKVFIKNMFLDKRKEERLLSEK